MRCQPHVGVSLPFNLQRVLRSEQRYMYIPCIHYAFTIRQDVVFDKIYRNGEGEAIVHGKRHLFSGFVAAKLSSDVDRGFSPSGRFPILRRKTWCILPMLTVVKEKHVHVTMALNPLPRARFATIGLYPSCVGLSADA